MLAGFEAPSEVAFSSTVNIADAAAPAAVNMMFQSYALFPHLTVEGSIAFGLRQENITRAEIGERVAEMLALRGYSFGDRRVGQLSGGSATRGACALADQAPARSVARRADGRPRQKAESRNPI